jgi:hypothetical protein
MMRLPGFEIKIALLLAISFYCQKLETEIPALWPVSLLAPQKPSPIN